MHIPPPTLPEIETERFWLRHLKIEDAGDYHSMEIDPEVKQFLGGPSNLSLKHYEATIAKGAAALATTLAVTDKVSEQFLGRCGFTEYEEGLGAIGWEINVVLGRQCPKKQGYATEIARALIQHGFKALNCDLILGVADAGNIASLRLCDRLGMQHQRDTIRYQATARIYHIRKPD
jgi:ribosomal-protein-alanine N-acetyltransferase